MPQTEGWSLHWKCVFTSGRCRASVRLSHEFGKRDGFGKRTRIVRRTYGGCATECTEISTRRLCNLALLILCQQSIPLYSYCYLSAMLNEANGSQQALQDQRVVLLPLTGLGPTGGLQGFLWSARPLVGWARVIFRIPTTYIYIYKYKSLYKCVI